MNTQSRPFPRDLAILLVLSALLLLALVYPFLPGPYDRLALPLSMLVQVFGVAGLPLSLIGLLWWLLPGRALLLARLSLAATVLCALILALFALLSGGKIFSLAVLAVGIYLVFRLSVGIKEGKTAGGNIFRTPALYLFVLPLFSLAFQLVLAKPLTLWSRNRAMANAGEFINHLETFRERNGQYPSTLQAMYKDYYPQLGGVEKYYYLPHGDSYNLSFEQPRFFFDQIGTREWIVYNPRDEHRAYSHTSWFLLLSPEELERSQGWFESGETGQVHWRYFLFD